MLRPAIFLTFGLGLLAGVLSVWVLVSRKPTTEAIPVVCQTTKGELNILVIPKWSPLGAERFLQLVDDGFYKDLPLFRCVDHFLCQFGAKPQEASAKTYSPIADDPRQPDLRNFKRGYLSFAGFGPNSRSSHVFITLGEVRSLGTQPWETPFGYVADESMDSTVAHFTTSYGESGPEPQRIEAPGGAEYLKNDFPLLDSFLSCSRKK